MSQEFKRSLPDSGRSFSRRRLWWSYTHLDIWLLLMLALLCCFGLLVLYSAAERDMGYVDRQSIRMVGGFLVMAFIAQIKPRTLRMLAPWFYGIGVLLLIAVIVVGVGAKGAQRWIGLPGGVRFQPAEIMKLALPMMIASYLARQMLPPALWRVAVALVMIAVPTVLIMKQPDLGTAMLIAASGVFVLLFSGIQWRWVALAGGLAAAALPALWMVMKDYQRQRVLTFLDPESDPLGTGWNIIQSKTAIGSGGLMGKGWLHGTQSQLNFLPESHTDFIIAVIGEELGMWGICLLLTIYLLIITRGLVIAVQAQDSFSRLLAGSVTLTFFVYVFVNIGMVSGLLPIVGVPLPMISYGGTSLVTLMAGFGILMSIHSHNNKLKR